VELAASNFGKNAQVQVQLDVTARRHGDPNLMAFLCAVVAVVLLTAVGCSSVSVCLEQEKGVSASEDARSPGCAPNRPTR